ncbi:chlorinating enzyme [Streptosporangium carneum]|uniref:Chemotaxis protein CheX n=1 Tax=Streptosporangium carneum TaxID=47481 RepID=A0A9W6MA91_9ACTN|nr:chlorinating enzyme [Streptosporangium carneum]GLK06762.1 chemotaxis protein CheX [Streptosporangium carneum]
MSQFKLTPTELGEFQRNGYAGPFTLYEPSEMADRWRKERLRLLDRSQSVYQDTEAISQGTNISNYDRHLDNGFLAEHIARPEIVQRVTSILGDDVICWRSEFFPKYPGDEGTDWHQADTFANAGGEPQIVWAEDKEYGGTITVWTAFTEATVETACLQFIPGTHRQMFYDESLGMHYDPEVNRNKNKNGVNRGFFGYDYRQLQIDPDWSPDESKAVSMELKPGQFIIFWSTLMHASHSHAGRTQEMRLGFVSRYVPASVYVYPDLDEIREYGGRISLDRFGCVLVSGEDRYRRNRLLTHTTTGIPFRRNGT